MLYLFKKRWFKLLAAILIILILTNPSAKRFKDFSGDLHYSNFRRIGNGVIFSIYKDPKGEYLGVFWNFFKIGG